MNIILYIFATIGVGVVFGIFLVGLSVIIDNLSA